MSRGEKDEEDVDSHDYVGVGGRDWNGGDGTGIDEGDGLGKQDRYWGRERDNPARYTEFAKLNIPKDTEIFIGIGRPCSMSLGDIKLLKEKGYAN